MILGSSKSVNGLWSYEILNVGDFNGFRYNFPIGKVGKFIPLFTCFRA